MSILIVKKLQFKKIVIGVPNIFLQKQFMIEILKIFPTKENILCVGGDSKNSTTQISRIREFIRTK